MLNTECPTCHKKFHSCSNCDFMHDWQYKYCSLDCFKESNEYKECLYFIKIHNLYSEDIKFISDNGETFWFIYLDKKPI
jgi:hypothetical protein